MINKSVTLTIATDNKTVSMSSPIVVYRGDGNINLQLSLAQQVYQYGRPITRMVSLENDVVNVNADVVRPNGKSFFRLNTVELIDNQFSITLAKEWVDEVEEVGTYYIQINTFDSEGNMATLPSFPVEVLPRLIDSVPVVTIGDLISSGCIGSDRQYVTHVAGNAVDIPYWTFGEEITVERMNEHLDIIKQNDVRINQAIEVANDVLQNATETLGQCVDTVDGIYNSTLTYVIVE